MDLIAHRNIAKTNGRSLLSARVVERRNSAVTENPTGQVSFFLPTDFRFRPSASVGWKYLRISGIYEIGEEYQGSFAAKQAST